MSFRIGDRVMINARYPHEPTRWRHGVVTDVCPPTASAHPFQVALDGDDPRTVTWGWYSVTELDPEPVSIGDDPDDPVAAAKVYLRTKQCALWGRSWDLFSEASLHEAAHWFIAEVDGFISHMMREESK